MGTKALGPYELLALVVVQRVLEQRVTGNEDGQQSRCDLRVIDAAGNTSGYVEVTRLIGEEYARTTAMLGGVETLRFSGRLNRCWSVTVADLRQREWLRAKADQLPDLLMRLEASGITRLPSIGNLSRIDSELDIAAAAGWDEVVAYELECQELGLTQLQSSDFRPGEGFAIVRAEGAVRGGWPESGPSEIGPWLSGMLASERLDSELDKLRLTDSSRQHLFIVIDRHPDLDTDIEMYLGDRDIGLPTSDPLAPEHLSDVWLVHTAPTVATHWNSESGWRRHRLSATIVDGLRQSEATGF